MSQMLSDFRGNDWNAAETAVISVTIQNQLLDCCDGHPRFWASREPQMR
jgi:hypothetical protein